MYNNIFLKNKERGVSLIITFFILTIILAVVLSISILLYGQIKIIRNIGNSVVAFYAADSGVEKVLYYDRKELPVVVVEEEEITGERGLCNICDACSMDCMPPTNGSPGDCVESHCQGCFYTNLGVYGCNPLTCDNCEIEFDSFFNGKSYEVKVLTTMVDELPNTSVESKGIFQDVSRKIQLQVEGGGSGGEIGPQAPSITNASATPNSVEEGTLIIISAVVTDPDGVASVTADVQRVIDEVNVLPKVILIGAGSTYTGEWFGPEGSYYIDIEACDTKNNCSILNNIPPAS